MGDFADRVMSKSTESCRGWPEDVLQEVTVDCFLRGCRDRAAAYAASERKPVTLYAAMRDVEDSAVNLKAFGRSTVMTRQVTFAEEVNQESAGPSSNSGSSSIFSKQDQDTLLSLLKSVLEGHKKRPTEETRSPASPPRARTRSPSPNNNMCFKCQETGHQSKDCVKPPVCFRCRGSGHIARDCPNAEYRTPPGSPGSKSPVKSN